MTTPTTGKLKLFYRLDSRSRWQLVGSADTIGGLLRLMGERGDYWFNENPAMTPKLGMEKEETCRGTQSLLNISTKAKNQRSQ
jgi:hypothetical protein